MTERDDFSESLSCYTFILSNCSAFKHASLAASAKLFGTLPSILLRCFPSPLLLAINCVAISPENMFRISLWPTWPTSRYVLIYRKAPDKFIKPPLNNSVTLRARYSSTGHAYLTFLAFIDTHIHTRARAYATLWDLKLKFILPNGAASSFPLSDICIS